MQHVHGVEVNKKWLLSASYGIKSNYISRKIYGKLMALNFCTTCYPLTLPDCPDSFDLETDLGAGTYYVWVEDRFAIKYVQEVTVGVDGVVTVNATAFQAGMFTANSGHYIFTISTSETEDTQETFTIDAADYDCWVIKFEEVNAA